MEKERQWHLHHPQLGTCGDKPARSIEQNQELALEANRIGHEQAWYHSSTNDMDVLKELPDAIELPSQDCAWRFDPLLAVS